MITEINEYIKTWQNRCYPELPDEAPREIDDMVPSYKRIAMAIMRGDLKMIGITPPKSKWYGILKRIELEERKTNLQNKVLQEQRAEEPNDLHYLRQADVAREIPNEGSVSNTETQCDQARESI